MSLMSGIRRKRTGGFGRRRGSDQSVSGVLGCANQRMCHICDLMVRAHASGDLEEAQLHAHHLYRLMLQHTQWCEEMLFPEFESRQQGSELLSVKSMFPDHLEIFHLLAIANERLEGKGPELSEPVASQELREALALLTKVLRSHVAWEDRVVYRPLDGWVDQERWNQARQAILKAEEQEAP